MGVVGVQGELYCELYRELYQPASSPVLLQEVTTHILEATT